MYKLVVMMHMLNEVAASNLCNVPGEYHIRKQLLHLPNACVTNHRIDLYNVFYFEYYTLVEPPRLKRQQISSNRRRVTGLACTP